MAWQNPVFDRTAADVAAGAEKCYFSPELLNRIEGNTHWLAEKYGVFMSAPRSWSSTDFLTINQMQRILSEADAVRTACRLPPGVWVVPAFPAVTWQAVNDLEHLQWKLYDIWQRNQADVLYVNEAYAGEQIGVL